MKEKMFKKVLFPKDQYYYLSDDCYLKDLERPSELLQKEAQEKLRTIAFELLERGFKVKAMTARGHPSSKILEMAQEEKISLPEFESRSEPSGVQLLEKV